MEQPTQQTNQYSGKEGEDPTTPFWASGNYVGPYWSNGKIQESVAFGSDDPIHELDALARLHDTAYATYKDTKHREAADIIFAEEARKLKAKYGPKIADDPRLAAAFVEYGNFTKRKVSQLANDVGSGFKFLGLPGALLGGIKFQVANMIENKKRIDGTYLKNELKEVRDLYSRDPKKGGLAQDPGNKGSTKQTGANANPGTSSDKPAASGGNHNGGGGSVARPGPTAKTIENAYLIEAQAENFRRFNQKYKNSLKSAGQKHGTIRVKPNMEGVFTASQRKARRKNKKNQVRPL